jgi:GTPase
MTQEHLAIAVALEVPFYIMVTKVDVAPRHKLQATLDSLQMLLKSVGSNKIPLVVKSGDDCITAAGNALKENVVPIFCVSSVTGSGLDMVKRFLQLLPPGVGLKEQEKLEQDNPEFQIDELFDLPHVGTVVGGLVTQGTQIGIGNWTALGYSFYLFSGIITEGVTMNIGPFEDGTFQPVTVSSIKRNRAGCRLVRATQSAALAIDLPISSLRRGMCLVDPRNTDDNKSSYFFQAKVFLLFHPTEIHRGFRTSVHIGNICQTAVIEGIHPMESIKSNDTASVVFRFRHPEYVKVGQRLLFRDGRTKGIGRVTQVFHSQQPEADAVR